MTALTDQQLATIRTAASSLDPERRDLYLQRVAAMLRVRGRFDDGDLIQVVALVQGAGAGSGRVLDNSGISRFLSK
jgi:hypothetical protein